MLKLIRPPAPVNLSAVFLDAIDAFKDVVMQEAAAARGADLDFQAAEQRVIDAVRRLGTAAIATVATATVPDCDVLIVGDRRFKRVREQTLGAYQCLHGAFDIARHLFRQIGVHNGPTIDPVAIRCGMVEGRYTPACAVGLAHLAQTAPSREAHELCESLGVLPYCRSTFKRGGDLVGHRWEAIRAEAEDTLIEEFEVPDNAVSVSFAVDRVSLPMEEDRELTPADRKRGIKRPVAVKLRMAYCAVWTLHDSEGRPLHSVRYAWLPEHGREFVESALREDALVLFAKRPDLRFVSLADGAPEMQNILDTALEDLPVVARLVDFWHLTEKLSDAIEAHLCGGVGLLAKWRSALLSDDQAIDDIEHVLLLWSDDYDDELPEGLYDALTYIENQRDRLRYATVRAANLPIGSGHVEATCKTIVAVRMKRCGARWRPDGAQPILNLRSLATSSRWKPAMRLLLNSYVALFQEIAA